MSATLGGGLAEKVAKLMGQQQLGTDPAVQEMQQQRMEVPAMQQQQGADPAVQQQ